MQVDLQVSQSAFSIYHLTRENSLHSPRINSTQLYSLEKNKSSLHGLHFIFCPLYGLPATFYWKFHQHHTEPCRPSKEFSPWRCGSGVAATSSPCRSGAALRWEAAQRGGAWVAAARTGGRTYAWKYSKSCHYKWLIFDIVYKKLLGKIFGKHTTKYREPWTTKMCH